MSIPTVKASTTHVDEGSDKISLARPDIKQNIDNVNEIIDHLTTTSGQQLIIPLTGFVVTESEVEGISDSVGASSEKFRMALLGGAYRLKGRNEDGSLTAAESSYGAIEGASVNTATPTLTEPTGYSVTGTNLAANVTNGTMTNTGATNLLNVLGNEDISNGQTCYLGYGEGYDSYVTLPAGTYKIQLLSTVNSITNNLTVITNASTFNETYENFVVWNKTDDTEITQTNLDIADWNTTGAAVFTLAAQKDVQFFNSYYKDGSLQDAPADDEINVGPFFATSLTGDIEGSGTSKTNFSWSPNIPERYGWVELVPNVYIEITKLS